MDIMGFIRDHIIVISIIVGLLAIYFYVIFCVTLNKLNKAMCGKTTWIAWVPVFNIFVLGKVTIHYIIGILLFLGFFLCLGVIKDYNGVKNIFAILPENILYPYIIVYCSLLVALFVYAYIKTKVMQRNGTAKDSYIQNRNVISAYDQKYSQKVENDELSPTDNNPNQNDSNNNTNLNNTSNIPINNIQSPLNKLMDSNTNSDSNNQQNP